MNPEVVYACTKCRTLFSPGVLYGDQCENIHCPGCGEPVTVEVGPAPFVTEKEGVYYLVDSTNCMGPYPNAEEAQNGLWAWFGMEGILNAEKEEGRSLRVIDGGKGAQESDQESDQEGSAQG